ncbi:MAG: TIGR00282 family metallophosphoesterase [Clostridia bacterium]|nr:TIGR00282 family metallophosphoesterase [Clostridia bacterium]
MKILAVGDIIGYVGVKELKHILPGLIETEGIDFIIVNAENSADGFGINQKNFDELIAENVDVITMGNHTWGKRDIFKFIDHPKLIRPANYPEGVVGKGYNIYQCKDKKIAVINLLGRAEINILTENPFLIAKKIVDKIENQVDMIFIDFHAEATGEKIPLGYYLDGRVTAVFGTHTHVQTADEKILPKGTAYITDIGMTGPKNSVLGMDIGVAIKRLTTSLPEKYKIAEGECIFNGVIFEVNDNTNKVSNIKRISL